MLLARSLRQLSIRIAAIGSKEFMPRILIYEDIIPNIKIIPYIYENPGESERLLDEIRDCDMLLFAGALPYFFAKLRVQQEKWPVVYIESYEYKLTMSLLHIRINGQQELNELSIDLPEEKHAKRVAEELGLCNHKWFVQDYSEIISGVQDELKIEEIIAFHQGLWESGATKFALTSVDYVYSRLCELEIPCFLMIVPEKAIYDAVKSAADYGQLMISKNSQIAIGIVNVNQAQSFITSGVFNQEATIVLHQMILEISKSAEVTIHQLGLDQFIIYGTRGGIEQIIIEFQSILFLDKINQLLNVTVSVGFGFGITAKVAEEHARIALFYASKNTDKNHVYLVTDEKEVIGPLNSDVKSYHLKSESKDVLDVAEETGLGVATINKIIQFLKLRRVNRFTAKDLAEYLEISRRSSERIIRRFVVHHFVEVVGEEQPHQQGRPRSVYRITFIDLD